MLGSASARAHLDVKYRPRSCSTIRVRCHSIRSRGLVGKSAAQGQPAVMFTTSDVVGECDKLQRRGGVLTLPPTDTTGSKIAKLNDGCGNLIQLTQLTW